MRAPGPQKLLLLTLALLALAALVPARAALPTKMPEDKVRGRQIYRESCWQCHGWTGEGNGPVSAALPTPAPPLAGRVQKDDFDALVKLIQQGKGDMPSYSQIMDTYESRRILVWLSGLDKDHPVDEGKDDPPAKDDDKPRPPVKTATPRMRQGQGPLLDEAGPEGPLLDPEPGGGP